MAEDKKRIVKNPESFRERALKIDQATPEASKTSVFLGFPIRLLKAFFVGIAKSYNRLASIKSLNPIFKVLSLIGKVIFPAYFRNALKELKGVTWPTGKQSIRLTYAVLAFALVFGVAVALVDYGLGKVFKVLLLK